MKLFISYPHDANAVLVRRLTEDLRLRGHEVWFDENDIKDGDDWRNRITRGILDSEQVVAFLSRHAVRDPGVCLNEIAIALAEKGDEAIVTVLVEPEREVQAPVSITHIQWLRMEDWAERLNDEGWYRTKLERLIEAIEHPGRAGRNDELEQLRLALDPLGFNADMALHLQRFSGRQWIIERFGQWLADEPASRVLRIEGGPGMGKTALVSQLVHRARSSVLGVHLCQYGRGDTRNPQRLTQTLAYQLASRLPDYRARLLRSPLIQRPELMAGKDAATLWSGLVAEPLAGVGRGLIERQRLALVIDGLDEATEGGRNDIVDLLDEGIRALPAWIGVVLTGRPDPEVTQCLATYQPFTISGDDPRNRADLQAWADAWMAEEVAANTLTTTQAKQAASQLVDRSEGAFLYLTQAREAAREGALDLTQPNAFPAGLGAIYLRFFKRRFPDASNDQSLFAKAVRPLLGYVLACPEPLPLALARELLGWKADDDGDLTCQGALQTMGSLLRHGKDDQGNPTLAPFHHSVREWMQDGARSGQFFVPTGQSREKLAGSLWATCVKEGLKIPGFVWQVLPVMLGQLDDAALESVLGAPDRSALLRLHELAKSLVPHLRLAAALPLWQRTVKRFEILSEAAPESAEVARYLSVSHDELGDLLKTLGKNDKALRHFERSMETRGERARAAPENAEFARDLSISHDKLGNLLQTMGNNEEALHHFRHSMEIRERLAEAAPESAEFARDLSISHAGLSNVLKTLGKSAEAVDHCERSVEIRERLAKAAPESTEFARDLSISHTALGDLLQTLGQNTEALRHYERSMETAERLAKAAPESAQFARDLSVSHDRLGRMLQNLGQNAEALHHYERSMEIAKLLAKAAPESATFTLSLSAAHLRVGQLLQFLSHYDQALLHFERSAEAAEQLTRGAAESAEFASQLATSLSNLGTLLAILGRKNEALSYARRSMEIRERLAHASPENAEFVHNLSCSCLELASMLGELGKNEEALQHLRQGKEALEQLMHTEPERTDFARALSASEWLTGDQLECLGKHDDALGHYERSIEIAEQLARAAPSSADFALDLAVRYTKLGALLETLGQNQEALRHHVRGMEVGEQLVRIYPENADFAGLLCGSYLQLSMRSEGDAQTWYIRKSVEQLRFMKSKGQLLPPDDGLLEELEERLRPRESTLPVQSERHAQLQQGRNDPCNCGSGKKFKACHGKIA